MRDRWSAPILALGLVAAAWPATADGGAGFCSKTAKSAFRACGAEVVDDFWIAVGNCINVSDPDERDECDAEAAEARAEGAEECRDQLDARHEVCDAVGEDRYDPDFDPEDFVDPDDIGGAVEPNPYFPLVPGAHWIYEGGDETITVVVTDRTKLIEGVTCRVVNDVVAEDGTVIEDTDDWYGQDEEGNVWYCGEEAKDYETFDGDDPEAPELVSIDGSWKAGRDGARPGTIMFAAPPVGETYREEMALGEAEDMGEVLSLEGDETVPAASCDEACAVIRAFTPLEPDAEETKYYKPGVGLLLEVDDEGGRVELVEFDIP